MEIYDVLSSPIDIHAATMQINKIETEYNRFQEVLNQMLEGEKKSIDEKEEKQMRKAAEMFESYFLNMMLTQMRSFNFDEDGYIPKGNAERIFTQMLDEEMSDQVAKKGGFGLADMLYAQMTRQFN